MAATKVALVLLFHAPKIDNRIFVLPIALGVVLAIPLVLIVTLAWPSSSLAGGGGQTSGATARHPNPVPRRWTSPRRASRSASTDMCLRAR
ncbi:MAG: hypothetical protein R2851_05525 [Caldilineaceae bacterium]